ncbi:HNH endonuclease signature motif containing protein [Agromyces sp. SYSU T00266]|uniref:HNH endonuclease signature motif containing protein n=1 Tax=Agromyces zhanjiangensis TaxID=3158562 RepID=UPI00339860F6
MTPQPTAALERTAPIGVLGDSVRREPGAGDQLRDALADVAALERMIRWAQAQQYRTVEAARRLHAEVEGVTGSSGSAERDMATRSFIAELATVLVAPEATAGRLAADAGRLTGPRSATLAALTAGSVGVPHVRSMLELTSDLPVDSADELERRSLDGAAQRTSSAFRQRVRRLRERVHPEPLATRRRRAADERRIHLDPAPDGMAWLSLFMEAERAVAIVDRLDSLAAASVARSDGSRSVGSRSAGPRSAGPRAVGQSDVRTPVQRCVDLAADLLMSGILGGDAAPATRRIALRVTVTVPVLSLLGVTDEPAELDGYGPIDAETARIIAAHAPTVRRLLVDPETGAALSYGRTSYRVGADLAGYLRVRDGRCRFPGCTRRAVRSDIDHTTAWAHGGGTEADNLAHLCRRHHRLKHESGWRVAQEPGGVIRWTSPAGHVLRTHPEVPFDPVPRSSRAAVAPLAHLADRSGAEPPSPEPVPPPSGPADIDDVEPPWLHAAPAA